MRWTQRAIHGRLVSSNILGNINDNKANLIAS
jgi:hypothetical protein